MMTLKEWRESEGMTQAQLAESMELSIGYISLLESGDRKPSFAVLNALERRSKGRVDLESFQ